MAQLSEAIARPITSVQFSNGDGLEGILKKLVKVERKGERLDRPERGYTGALMVQRIYDVVVTLRHCIQEHGADIHEVSVESLQQLGGITDANGLASALATAFRAMSADEFLGLASEDIDGDILALINHTKAQIVAQSSGLRGFLGGVDARSVTQGRGMAPRYVETPQGKRSPAPVEIRLSVPKKPAEISPNIFEDLEYIQLTGESESVVSTHASDKSLSLDDLDSFMPLEFSDVHYIDLGSIIAALVNIDRRRQTIGGMRGIDILQSLFTYMREAHRILDGGGTFEGVARGANLDYLRRYGIPQNGNVLIAMQNSIGGMPEDRFRNVGPNGPLPQIVRAIRECQTHLA